MNETTAHRWNVVILILIGAFLGYVISETVDYYQDKVEQE